jgi:predicted dienelactone hydrolase
VAAASVLLAGTPPPDRFVDIGHVSSARADVAKSGSNERRHIQKPVAAEPTRIGAFAIGRTELAGIARPVSGVPSRRPLPTTVWYPAVGHGGGQPPDRARAPYPLLVFSEGYDSSVGMYSYLLESLASAGFVVAAPTYPDTDRSGPLNESDIVNHPADLRYVIGSLLERGSHPGSPLSGLIAANEVGVLGQSDGAVVTLAVAADSCCLDRRVRAAAVLSGAELTSFGGSYFTAGSPPLLVTQGNADTINAPACSAQLYDDAPWPKYYLDLLGAEHVAPYLDPGRDREIVAKVVTDFFAAELLHRPAAISALATDGNVARSSRLTHAASAPQPTGNCPGAPP